MPHALARLYPDYDFALLPRRAWAASLVVDYLDTLPQVDKKHIAIFGYFARRQDGLRLRRHSIRGSRRSLPAQHRSGRRAAVARFQANADSGEGIETTTRRFPTWFAPQLRFFAGREDRLPVDGNLLAAMIAPRPLLMEWGNNDQVVEHLGQRADLLLGARRCINCSACPTASDTLRVPGFHGANDEEADLDWLDMQFGRSDAYLDRQPDLPVGLGQVAHDTKQSARSLANIRTHDGRSD